MNDVDAKVGMNKQLREWLLWTAATTGGWLLGATLTFLLTFVLSMTSLGAALNPDTTNTSQPPDLLTLVISLAMLLIIGGSVGALQWLVLRRHVADLQRWAAFTGLGFTLGVFAYWPFMGVGVGLLQWLLLRRDLNKTIWWAVINALAWPVGYMLGGILGFTLGTTLGSALISNLLSATITGALTGAITGAALLWLLRENAELLESLRQDKELAKR